MPIFTSATRSGRARTASVALLGALLIGTGLGGCSSIGDAIESVSGVSVAEDPDEAEVFSAEYIRTATADLAKAVGASDPQITRLSVNGFSVVMSAVDPEAPDELNEWTYRSGSSSQTATIDYGGDPADLAGSVFALSEVSPDVVAASFQAAAGQAAIKEGVAEHVSVGRGIFVGDPVHILVQVGGERDSKSVEFDLAGQLVKIF